MSRSVRVEEESTTDSTTRFGAAPAPGWRTTPNTATASISTTAKEPLCEPVHRLGTELEREGGEATPGDQFPGGSRGRRFAFLEPILRPTDAQDPAILRGPGTASRSRSTDVAVPRWTAGRGTMPSSAATWKTGDTDRGSPCRFSPHRGLPRQTRTGSRFLHGTGFWSYVLRLTRTMPSPAIVAELPDHLLACLIARSQERIPHLHGPAAGGFRVPQVTEDRCGRHTGAVLRDTR